MLKTFLVVTCALLVGCSDNNNAHNYGGTEKIKLPVGEHFVDAYWDAGDHLWYTTRPMTADEKPSVYVMQEKSAFGSMQGVVTFIETK